MGYLNGLMYFSSQASNKIAEPSSEGLLLLGLLHSYVYSKRVNYTVYVHYYL